MLIKWLKNPYLLTVLSGVLCVLSFPPYNLSFLIWIALVPLFYTLTNKSNFKKGSCNQNIYKAIFLGFIFGIVFYFGTLYWLYNVFNVPGFFLILFICIYPSIFSVFLFLLYHKFNKKIFLLFLPFIIWISVEYFKSEGWWMKFSWMNLGYSQHDNMEVLQFASVLGQYGLSALIVLVNSIITFNLIKKFSKLSFITSMLMLLIIYVGILTHSQNRLFCKYLRNINVALIQDESSDFSIYKNIISKVDSGYNFIVLPEYALPICLDEDMSLLTEIKNITKKKQSYFVVGSVDNANIKNSSAFYNTAYLFNPSGEIIGKYYKMNPIQFFNDGLQGSEFSVFNTKYGKLGLLICYDMDYSYVARNITKNGAEFLFIPTYDALKWGNTQHIQHSSMTSMRAVENGRYIVRVATSGISQVVDPFGRVVVNTEIGKTCCVKANIAAFNKLTFYSKYGYLFPYINILLLIIFFVKLIGNETIKLYNK